MAAPTPAATAVPGQVAPGPVVAVHLLVALSGVCGGALAGYCWVASDDPGSTAFAVALGVVSVGAAAAGGAEVVASLAPVAVGNAADRLLLVLAVLAVPAFLVFALQYSGRGIDPAGLRALLLYAPAALLATVLVLSIASPDLPEVLEAVFGVGFLFAVLSLVGELFVGVAALAATVARYRYPPARRAAALSLVVVLPLAADVALLAFEGGLLGSVDDLAVPVAVGAAGLAVLRDGAFETTPAVGTIGERAVAAEVGDVVVIADTEGRVVDRNDTARRLLDGPSPGTADDPTGARSPSGPGADAAPDPGVRSPAAGADWASPTRDGDADTDAGGDADTDGDDDTDDVGADPGTRAGTGDGAGDGDGAGPTTVADLFGITVEELAEAGTVAVPTGAGERLFDPQVTDLSDRYGRHVGYLASLRDVTDREIRKQRLAVLNRVLRHNLRNDMTVVRGHADLIAEALPEDHGARSHAAVIDDHAAELIEVSETARDLQRAFEGGESAPRNLVDPVERAVERVRREYPAATVSLSAPATARAVAVPAARPAVEEVVENAAEHAGPAPDVEVAVAAGEDAVTVTVEDDGPGIPAAEREAIDRRTETQLEHAGGLGLWFANWVLASCGGDLSIDVTDRGSRVTLAFPAADAAAPDPDPERADADPPPTA